MFICADIGGTFVRFGQAENNAIRNIQKFEVAEFDSFANALACYCNDQNLGRGGELRIATAGYEQDGVWKFVNKNPWHIDPQALRNAGWNIEIILNDFEAATWALTALKGDELEVIKDAQGASTTQCLVGPGTGLGLAYFHKDPKYVQKTHGGHMAASAMSEEQWIVLQAIRRQNPRNTIVYENLVSGPGLMNIYNAICLVNGLQPEAVEPEDLLERQDHKHVQQAVRLFHEFFGSFASMAVVTGNAYGGLYITGGVVERLKAVGLFDVDTFLESFRIDAVDSVKRDLGATSILYIKDPYPALKGLMHVE